MKELIPMDEYGVFCDAQDTARANSLMVAKVFDKRHADVLRDIEKITAPKSGLSKEFGERNFALSSYKSEQNKKLPCYNMTRDGFTLLVMGYTAAKMRRSSKKRTSAGSTRWKNSSRRWWKPGRSSRF